MLWCFKEKYLYIGLLIDKNSPIYAIIGCFLVIVFCVEYSEIQPLKVMRMLKELNEFKFEKLEKYLNEDSVDEGFLVGLFEKTLSRPELLKIRVRGRKERNYFFNKLYDLTVNDYPKANSVVCIKYKILYASEEIFDLISNEIEECYISKKDKKIQIWSHIKRVEKEFNDLRNLININLSKDFKERKLSPYASIKNDDDQEFCPDTASENLVKYLTITIKLLAYKFDWFDAETLIIPNQVDIDEENIYQAGSIELLARSWLELEDITQRSILFGGEVYKIEGDNIPDKIRNKGVNKIYRFDREESEYEFHDAIACERVRKKYLQHFMQLISNKDIRENVAVDIDSVGRLEDYSFLCEEEVLACLLFDDVFCVKTIENDDYYHGLTLTEWIRSYFIIQYISKEISQGLYADMFTEAELFDKFKTSGFSKDKFLKFIELASFSKNSKDIYDCPLIKTDDGRFYLSYYGCVSLNVTNVVLSRLSSLDANSSKKGYEFEKQVNLLISKILCVSKSFKFKRGADEYEYDSVFILDSRIFILECKNRSLSWYNPVKGGRSKKYLFETIQQVSRLKDALKSYPEVMEGHFGVDCSNYEIIPVIFNCMPFSWLGEVNGVYITDFSSFSRLLESSSINVVSTNLNGQMAQESHYKQWDGNEICSDDIVRHFKKPIQIIPFVDSRDATNQLWVGGSDVAFTVKTFSVNPEKYSRKENEMFNLPDD